MSRSMAFGLTLFMSTWCARENARRDKFAAEVGTQELTESDADEGKEGGYVAG